MQSFIRAFPTVLIITFMTGRNSICFLFFSNYCNLSAFLLIRNLRVRFSRVSAVSAIALPSRLISVKLLSSVATTIPRTVRDAIARKRSEINGHANAIAGDIQEA